MRSYLAAVIATAATLVVQTSRAEEAAPGAAEELPVPAAAASAEDQPQEQAEKTADEDRWRFKYHNGHWWYWLPSDRWVYWDGAAWENYEPKAYAAWYLRQRQERYRAEVARYDAMRATDAIIVPGPFYGPFGMPYPYPPFSARFGMWPPGIFGITIGSGGNFNYATSVGGYMGDALRGPTGY